MCAWVGVHMVLHWSSGYDARLTRERSPVQSWDEVLFFAAAKSATNQ